MHRAAEFPLDYASSDYAYVERPNSVLLSLLFRHVLSTKPRARVLDVGCGAGANARVIRERAPSATIVGIEPNARAATLAREVCDEVCEGTLDDWLGTPKTAGFDAVLLSDVLEHVADPLGFLRRLVRHPSLLDATWLISVPNYAVWYNRLRTLMGRFDYAFSGLYDRTHLRFFTRSSLGELLRHAGLMVDEDVCTPSLVQSAAPILRRLFERDVQAGNHLALGDSAAFRAYQRFIEPSETRFCQGWPELLGFQIVCVARLD